MYGRSPRSLFEITCTTYFRKIEAAWDESLFIDGYPGEYFCIARRKNKKWFIAAITNEQSRILRIPLSFLEKGKHHFVIYSDEKGNEMHSCSVLSTQKIQKNILIYHYYLMEEQ